MKLPAECSSLAEIRNEIDRIDISIINLLGERFEYVKEVVKFKSNNKEDIIAQKRYNQVICNARKLALNKNLNPDMIEKIYKILLNHFIEEEILIANKNNNK